VCAYVRGLHVDHTYDVDSRTGQHVIVGGDAVPVEKNECDGRTPARNA
jgi:hypothetical protein